MKNSISRRWAQFTQAVQQHLVWCHNNSRKTASINIIHIYKFEKFETSVLTNSKFKYSKLTNSKAWRWYHHLQVFFSLINFLFFEIINVRSAHSMHKISARGKLSNKHFFANYHWGGLKYRRQLLPLSLLLLYLKTVSVVFVVFRVGLQIIDIDCGQTRYKQLQFLFVEYGY